MTEETGTALAKWSEARNVAGLSVDEWNDDRLTAIYRTVCPEGTTQGEMGMFMAVAARYDLDPFLKEIWLTKDERGKLMVLTGRDSFVKAAGKDPGYLGIESGVVRDGDNFQIRRKDGTVEVQHDMGVGAGKPVAGYCVAYHETKKPVVVVRPWVYYQHLHGKNNWKKYPDDMIETRCICAALRRLYTLSGIYTPEEFQFGVDTDDVVTDAEFDSMYAQGQTVEKLEELKARMAETFTSPVPDPEAVRDSVMGSDIQTAEVVEDVPNEPVPLDVESVPQNEGEYAHEGDTVLHTVGGDSVDVTDPDEAIDRARKAYFAAINDHDLPFTEGARHAWQGVIYPDQPSTKEWDVTRFIEARLRVIEHLNRLRAAAVEQPAEAGQGEMPF